MIGFFEYLPLILEIRKLPIESLGVSMEGMPFVTLQKGYTLYGYVPTLRQKLAYEFFKIWLKKIKMPNSCFSVAMDIILRYKFAHALACKVPPYNKIIRRCFHRQHRTTVWDIPSISKELRDKLIEKFTLKQGDIVVDVGSYIGYGALGIRDIVGSSGKIIAIECDRENLKFLNKNISENNLDNIVVIDKAIWKDKRKASLRCFQGQAKSLIPTIVEEVDTIQVEADTLDNIIVKLSLSKITLISLTINGSEPEAIEGMGSILDLYSPSLSIAGWYKRNGVPIWKIIIPMLKEKGYKSIKIGEGRVLAWKDDN